MYALVTIQPDGSETVKTFAKRPTLEPLQAAVGGLIERVKVRWQGRVREAYVNEEGLLVQLPFNRRATELAFEFGYRYLVGPLTIIIPNSTGGSNDEITD